LGKLAGVLTIIAASLVYDRVPAVQAMLQPIVRASYRIMRLVADLVGFLTWPLRKTLQLLGSQRKPAPERGGG
jgi:hypothetical protein